MGRGVRSGGVGSGGGGHSNRSLCGRGQVLRRQLSSPEPTTSMTVQGGVDVVELTKH